MISPQKLGCAALLCLLIAAATDAARFHKRSLVINTRRARDSHSAFIDIESYAKNSVKSVKGSPSPSPLSMPMSMSMPIKHSSGGCLVSGSVSLPASERHAVEEVGALDESHPNGLGTLESLQLEEIGNPSLVSALHGLTEAVMTSPSKFSQVAYGLEHFPSKSSLIREIAPSSAQLIEDFECVETELSDVSSLPSELRSVSKIIASKPEIFSEMSSLETLEDSNLPNTIAALNADDASSSSIVSEIESLISAEESDVQLQSAISNILRDEATEYTLVSQLLIMAESPNSPELDAWGTKSGHTNTYEYVERIASLKSSRPSLLSELNSIEDFEQSHSSVQRYVESLMSIEETSALTSIENIINQEEFDTCTCAESIRSELASFVELEIAYPYLAQDIVLIHKAKVAHSALSAALDYVSSFARRHARTLSEIYFDEAHTSIETAQMQLASLLAADSKLFSALDYLHQIEASYEGLSTALSVVSVVKLADPTVVTVIEYIVHEQSSEMSAARYIGALVSSHPLMLQDLDIIESYETRYPQLASFEELISTAYATEPTNVEELESAMRSPLHLAQMTSLTSIEQSEPTLWAAVQYVEKISLEHPRLSKATKSIETLTHEHPSAIQNVIFEEEMDSSLVLLLESMASVKMRHPSIPRDVDYVNDLEILNSGLASALQCFAEAESTSPTVLSELIHVLSDPVKEPDAKTVEQMEQQHPSLWHCLEVLYDITRKHPSVVQAYSSIQEVQRSSPSFTTDFELAQSLTQSTVMSNLASIEVVQSSHPSFISDAEYLLHVAAAHQNLMSAFNSLETAQVSSPSTVYDFFKAENNRTAVTSSYFQELVKSYTSLWTEVEYVNQLGLAHPLFAHDLDEVLSIVKSHPHIIADLLSIEAGTNPSVTAAEKLGVEEEQSICATTAVPHVQEVEEEIVEPKPKFVSSLNTGATD